MIFERFNKNILIKNKIFLGFLGSLVGVIFSLFISINSFNEVSKNFNELDNLNSNVASLLNLKNLVNDLKKNVVTFVYTGRKSIGANAETLVREIDTLITSIGINDSEVTSMKKHLDNYAATFEKARLEFRLKENLINQKIPETLNDLKQLTYSKEISRLEVLIWQYQNDPSSNKSRLVLKKINTLINGERRENQKELIKLLRKSFVRFSQAVRGYLYLINVVMAGEASEIEYISKKIQVSSINKIKKLKLNIQKQNETVKKRLIYLFIIFSFLLLFYSWLITKSISSPLESITNTLNKITSGEVNVTIPEQDRNDEIGTLSKAASIFSERSKMLERSNEELAQFAYRTSHDLKAPLATIKGLTVLMEEDLQDGDSDEVMLNIKKVNKQATKLEKLVVDILDLSKSDLEEKSNEEFEVYNMIVEMRESYSDLLNRKDVTLSNDIDKELKIYTQKTRIKMILGNLISNAIKYSDPKKQNRFVKVSCHVQNDISFIIEDNGLGIKPENHNKLYDMFTRFNAESSGGSGLGMSIVKKNVDILNGKISFNTNAEGTTFIVTIPNATNR